VFIVIVYLFRYRLSPETFGYTLSCMELVPDQRACAHIYVVHSNDGAHAGRRNQRTVTNNIQWV